jgi:hypothetical protein
VADPMGEQVPNKPGKKAGKGTLAPVGEKSAAPQSQAADANDKPPAGSSKARKYVPL